MAQTNKRERHMLKIVLLLLLSVVCVTITVLADPSGATITSNSTVYGPVVNASMRNDSRGSITTLVLSAMQQNQEWKAYVGNVSGGLTLDNPSRATIYSWDLTSVSGQVYASRYNNISWASGNIVCASPAVISAESTFNNMSGTEVDRINATFNWTLHKQFLIGTNTIAQNTCNSTFMNVNDTRQTPSVSSPFQEVLIMDSANSYMIYMASIDHAQYGYDNTTYDFQMIVAESAVKTTPTPYYFYVELR